MRRALWIGTTIDLILFLPALWIAFTGLAVAGMASAGAAAYLIVAVLFPGVCIVAPVLAWKLFDRSHTSLAVVSVISPLLYGAAVSVGLLML